MSDENEFNKCLKEVSRMMTYYNLNSADVILICEILKMNAIKQSIKIKINYDEGC